MASFINFEQTWRFRPSLWSVPAVTPNKIALHSIVAQHRCRVINYQPQNPLESVNDLVLVAAREEGIGLDQGQ
jgi:hypothetical protein